MSLSAGCRPNLGVSGSIQWPGEPTARPMLPTSRSTAAIRALVIALGDDDCFARAVRPIRTFRTSASSSSMGAKMLANETHDLTTPNGLNPHSRGLAMKSSSGPLDGQPNMRRFFLFGTAFRCSLTLASSSASARDNAAARHDQEAAFGSPLCFGSKHYYASARVSDQQSS